jgi:hypothetical protein
MKFLIAVLFVFLPACGDGILIGGETDPPPPPPGYGHWGKITDNNDGHYNVKLANVSVSCPEEKKYSDAQEKWDYIAYDEKSGRLKFPDTNTFYWYDIEINLDEKGKFRKTVKTGPIYFFTQYIGYEMEISGRIADKKLEAQINYRYFASENLENDNLKLTCEFVFEATGYRRYAPKRAASQRLAGEYGAKVKTKKNTCIFDGLPKQFGLELVPQKDNLINLRMPDFLIAELPIDSDGKTNVSVSTEFDSYDIRGTILPDGLALGIIIKRSLYGCEQEYEISGTKRFEESSSDDTTIDGIYGISSYLEKNTCDDRPKDARFHLDALKIDEKTARIILGNKDFTGQADGAEFSASYSDGSALNGVTNTFSGKLTPQEIKGTLTVSIILADFITNTQKKCEFIYQISGYKLYKHN